MTLSSIRQPRQLRDNGIDLPFGLRGGRFHRESINSIDGIDVDVDRCPVCGYDRAIVGVCSPASTHFVRCASPDCETLIEQG